MRITQGTFSYLPDLTDDEIKAQVQYAIDNEWSVSIEFTDDPHPRNSLWEMWGLPMFDLEDASAVVMEVNNCRKAYPNHYARINAYDPRHGRRTIALQFMVNRPKVEPGFRLDRTETADRRMHYTLHSYAAEQPHGARYQDNGKGPEPD
ncbi:MAG: ribulose bisphosphate carboxylase small subunit [Acidimicrobiales bacterium]